MAETFLIPLFAICALGLTIWIVYVIFQIVGEMAEARGHSPWPWWIISLCTSPFTAMFLLWLFFDLTEPEHNLGTEK
jgi:hypothetical protein